MEFIACRKIKDTQFGTVPPRIKLTGKSEEGLTFHRFIIPNTGYYWVACALAKLLNKLNLHESFNPNLPKYEPDKESLDFLNK